MNGPHTGYTLTEAVRCYLPLVPIDEDRIYGHKTQSAAHAHCSEKARLASPTTGISTDWSPLVVQNSRGHPEINVV